MTNFQMLLVAGTHGNEVNAPWLFEHWDQNPNLINSFEFNISKIIGNPEALGLSRRYIDSDLNRAFSKDLLNSNLENNLEANRAKYILKKFGPDGENPCSFAIDLHSTTASMGNSIVIYGRRYADLALASLLQSKLGLPIYLHEADKDQRGFLVEAWPCGFVLEIGPVPQSLLDTSIIEKYRLTLEVCFQEIEKFLLGRSLFPKNIVVHRHIGSIDFPRDSNNKIASSIHPSLYGMDWHPIMKNQPLFVNIQGEVDSYTSSEEVVPVFINEAAYAEKNIAMSLTKKEVWDFREEWQLALMKLLF